MYQLMWIVWIWLGTRQKIRTRKHSSNGALYVLLKILFHFCPSFFSIFLLSLFSGILWLFLFISLIFFSLRSTKEVTTENMSLNKWKSWPVENSEIMLKIDIKLVSMTRGSYDQFLAKIKFSEPSKTGMSGSEFFVWSILIYGTSKSEFVCEN